SPARCRRTTWRDPGKRCRGHEALKSANCLRLAEFLRFSFMGPASPGSCWRSRQWAGLSDMVAAAMIKP
ncbi:MAG: hypothetical protein PHQ97_15280, partial [Desulfobacterales bacterium]|nr:hypothetical protein [Desulfobacterales bacterium]